MKQEVKTPVIVVAVLAVVGVAVWFGMQSMNSGGLDQGQVKYTPGKPPWEETDPSKRGPGGAPPSPQGTAPAGNAPGGMAPGGPPPGGNLPPGMTAPALGNSSK